METKDNIELPPLHYDELPEPDDPIPAMHNYARRAIKADRQRRSESVKLPSDAELVDWAAEEQFFLFCDEDEFLDIAHALLARYVKLIEAS